MTRRSVDFSVMLRQSLAAADLMSITLLSEANNIRHSKTVRRFMLGNIQPCNDSVGNSGHGRLPERRQSYTGARDSVRSYPLLSIVL